MKLKIDGKEYGLYWGLPAFGAAGEDLNGMTPTEIIGNMSNVNVSNTLAYHAISLWYKINEDDKHAKLPFGEMRFISWLDEQPQSIADDIFKSFLEFTTHGTSWAEKLDIDISKLYASVDKDAEKEEPKKKVSKRTPKSS